MTDHGLVRITGNDLCCADIVTLSRDGAGRIELDPTALERVRSACDLATQLSTWGNVYGRTTGVGANRHVAVDPERADEHGMRLLRSHAGGYGTLLPDASVRALMIIRLNQLAAGGSGVQPDLVTGLDAALRTDSLPRVHSHGRIGTGDLAALAELGLTLAGERPWATGGIDPVSIGSGDALAFMSSNAATLGEAVLAADDLGRLLAAGRVVTALTFSALGGAPEAYAEAVHRSRPHPGTLQCAAAMRRLLGSHDQKLSARRLQDPFGLRTFPQVSGAAQDAWTSLQQILTIEVNAAAENPLIDPQTGRGYHHGQFATPHLAQALDHLRAAVDQVAQLSAARLTNLTDPALTELTPFLSAGPAGSSGIMILEYVTQDALAELRHAAAPVTLGNAVISRGLEDNASFAPQAVRDMATVVRTYRTVLACEVVGAVRALRMSGVDLPDAPVRAAYEQAAAVLTDDTDDHVLTPEIEQAERLLGVFADLDAG